MKESIDVSFLLTRVFVHTSQLKPKVCREKWVLPMIQELEREMSEPWNSLRPEALKVIRRRCALCGKCFMANAQKVA